MSDKPASLTSTPQGYADWLADLKGRIHSAQQRAMRAVNRMYMRAFAEAWPEAEIVQQAVGQLPWSYKTSAGFLATTSLPSIEQIGRELGSSLGA